jgi:hypothetical protein
VNITISEREAALLRELLRATRKHDPRDVAAQVADGLLTALGDGPDLATVLDRDGYDPEEQARWETKVRQAVRDFGRDPDEIEAAVEGYGTEYHEWQLAPRTFARSCIQEADERAEANAMPTGGEHHG